MTTQKYVILVDKNDKEIGVEEKLVAHQQAKLHRAFSIFILRQKNNAVQLLLQQRQHNKYHSAGLWTNTCCSHPTPGESILLAGQRRLKEEMGITVPLREIGCFHYIAKVSADLTENEIDHVLIGEIDNEEVTVDVQEVADYRWIDILSLKKDLHQHPEKYTAWFSQALDIVLQNLRGNA